MTPTAKKIRKQWKRCGKEKRNAGMPIFDAVTTLNMIRLVRSAKGDAECWFADAGTLTDEVELALFCMEDELVRLLLKPDKNEKIAQRSGNSD